MTSTVGAGTSSQPQPASRLLARAVAKPDIAATRYLFTSTAFLAVGAVMWFAVLLSMRFPGLFPVSFGKLRAVAFIAVYLGWLVPGLFSGVLYLLPRLTGVRLQAERLANLGLIAFIGVVLVGVALVMLGFGDGREPFALPWWWDLPTLGVLALPAVVVGSSLRKRRERTVYPSLWFLLAGAIWLPFLYMVGNLPELRQIASTLGDLVFSAGFLHVWTLGLATGIAYYVVPKASGQPLYNRQLARVGLWSILFGAVWMGPAQLGGGPAPEWLAGIASVLGLALPVGAGANAVNLALTIGGEWKDIGRKPILLAAMIGSALAVVAATITAIAGFRSAAVLVGFTAFWEGWLHLMVFGAAVLLFASFAWQAVPNLVGRDLRAESRAVQLTRRAALTNGAVALLLVISGLTAGYGWAGAGFSGEIANVGEGWAVTSAVPGVFALLAVLAAIFGTWYTLGLALSIYQTLTSGRPSPQEVLVVDTSGEEHE